MSWHQSMLSENELTFKRCAASSGNAWRPQVTMSVAATEMFPTQTTFHLICWSGLVNEPTGQVSPDESSVIIFLVPCYDNTGLMTILTDFSFSCSNTDGRFPLSSVFVVLQEPGIELRPT